MGPPPKRDQRCLGWDCSDALALDGPPEKRPNVPKWKRFLVQNTKGSIKREVATNGDTAVPELLPWPSSIVPGYGKMVSPRVQRIRYPGVNPKTPIIERPLNLPYASATYVSPRRIVENSSARRPPWAVGENFQPDSIRQVGTDDAMITMEERGQAYLPPRKIQEKLSAPPWAVGSNFQADSTEREDGKHIRDSRRNRPLSLLSSTPSAASPQMSVVRTENSSAKNPPWALGYGNEDNESKAANARRNRRRDKSRDKLKETLPICPGAQKADQDTEANK